MRRRIEITGVVQGVGFRPFVYNLARNLGLSGWCRNNNAGLSIEVEGNELDSFIEKLRLSPPPLARIDNLRVEKIPPLTTTPGKFVIEPSAVTLTTSAASISPDISTCPDCIEELFNSKDRRYLYPFINCTNCGPRYSITMGVPYDRTRTTMADFKMCEECRAEYEDPGNRRFHAQPNCCAECGPKVWVEGNGTRGYEGICNYAAIEFAQKAITDGAIVATKGLGGFHIACNATDEDALGRLRSFKRASLLNGSAPGNKPFALMVSTPDRAREFAIAGKEEQRLLSSATSPILLLDKRAGEALPKPVAPGCGTYGVMLPYTPLHHLLFHGAGSTFKALVMTSGNLSDEPIETNNEEAVERLSGIADLFLLHDRAIHLRIDDSIAKVENHRMKILRRARGIAPLAIGLMGKVPNVIAFGAEQKNTFCIGTESVAILSPHIGDLDTVRAIEFEKKSVVSLLNTNNVNPQIVAHDLHPDYQSTHLAKEYAGANSIPKELVFAVQHHHAHIVSCKTEHALEGQVIGVAFDGTGAGEDGNIWGGEFLISDNNTYRRAAHFKYVPMAGAERAVLEPWRMGLGYILDAYNKSADEVADRILGRIRKSQRATILKMIEQKINSPLTSSVGRLFDAISSILNIRDYVTYEGEAAVELETIADSFSRTKTDKEETGYCYAITEQAPYVIDVAPTVKAIIKDIESGVAKGRVALRFHITLAEIITGIAERLSQENGINDIVLSGGVFQNRLLSLMAEQRLTCKGLTPWFNEAVPTNDGGISLGQMVVATERFKKSRS